jgi:ribose transport system substrate-binding protein
MLMQDVGIRRGSTAAATTLLLATALLAAGCGKTSAPSSAASTQPAALSASSGCGSQAQVGYHDETGLIKTLPAQYAQAYDAFPDPIQKSAWSSFKPKGKPPYTVGVAVTAPVNSFSAELAPALEKDLKAIPGVTKVVLLTSSPTGLTQQIQQTNQLIQEKVSVIINQPLLPQAFATEAAKAYQAGIPFISITDATPSPDAISITNNAVNDGLWSGAQVEKLMGGKGAVMGVQGIPSVGVNQQEFAGWKQAFARCPGISFDSSLIGQFQAPVAKQQVQTYLTSHPQPVAGAVETAGMTSGIIQAFEQSGRSVPAMADMLPSVGTLSYWLAHRSTYKAVAATMPAPDVAEAAAYTTSELLSGHGPKINELVGTSLRITSANLSEYAKPGLSLSDATAVTDSSDVWEPKSYLARLFNK